MNEGMKIMGRREGGRKGGIEKEEEREGGRK